jgi:SRSO17 transposase
LGSATLVDDSIIKCFCGIGLGAITRIAVSPGTKKDDPPRFSNNHSRRIVTMTWKQIAALGRKLVAFLQLFADCFGRREARELLRVYLQGQLSDLHRKTAEGIALRFGKAPRTLQRFLETIKWDEEKFHDRCQRMVAQEHGHPEAIGVVDESGVAKSGEDTVGVGRQWNGNRGKLDNCVVGVHLSYAAPGFQCLLGSGLYLPREWADDPVRRKKTTFPTR